MKKFEVEAIFVTQRNEVTFKYPIILGENNAEACLTAIGMAMIEEKRGKGRYLKLVGVETKERKDE